MSPIDLMLRPAADDITGIAVLIIMPRHEESDSPQAYEMHRRRAPSRSEERHQAAGRHGSYWPRRLVGKACMHRKDAGGDYEYVGHGRLRAGRIVEARQHAGQIR